MSFVADSAVPVSAQARAKVAPEQAFDIVAPIDLRTIFPKTGPFPGIALVRDQRGAWDAVGQTRTLVLTDGSTARETLTEYASGTSFAYELDDIAGLLGRLVAGVRGEWTFTPDGAATIIRWTWELTPKRGRSALVRFGLAPAWRGTMRAAVSRSAAACERATSG